MALDSVASISKTFNANLAPIMTMPLGQSADPKASTISVAQDSVDKTPQLAGNIERLQGVLGHANPQAAATSGVGISGIGAVGFAAAIVGGPVGAAVSFGASLIDGARFMKPGASSPAQEPTQFMSFADVKAGQDIMDLENEQLRNGSYTDAMGGVSVNGGFVVNQPAYAGGLQTSQANSLSGKDRRNMESALGAMEQQFAGLRGQSEAAEKFARQEGIGGMPGGIKMTGNVASGWTPPPPGFGV